MDGRDVEGEGCTGILVTHDDGRVECLDPVCTDPDAVHHDWRLSCADLGEPCPACAKPHPHVLAA